MSPERLHLGIAEQGKLHAVSGDHRQALMHYREAMRHAVASGSQEVFFRHYLECTLESLEHLGAYAEVLEYCQRATAHYETHPPAHEVARLDLATVLERQGIVLAKQGRPDEARVALDRALEVAGSQRGRLLLAPTLRQWLSSGLHVSAERVQIEQQHRKYFVVRPDNVRREMALPLPGRGLDMPPVAR